MNTKIIIAAVAGSVAAFLLGWVVWGMLLMDYFQEHTYQYEGMMLADTEMKLWAIYISNLASAVLMAWLFDNMKINSFMGGLTAGAIITFLIALSFDMMFYSMMNWYKDATVIVVDLLVNAGFGAIIGGIIAAMLGRGGAKTAAA